MSPTFSICTGLGLGLVLAGALLLPGCAAKQEREAAMAVQLPGQEAAYGTQDDRGDASAKGTESTEGEAGEGTELYADLVLLATCGIEAPTVYFEYGSANLRRAAQVELRELAECLQRPPLAGRELEVIGHADETGSEGYNEGLGMRRATAVADQLVAQGLERERVHALSAGERKADDPNGWDDRRVIIRLEDEQAARRDSSPQE
jgi:outer membrane protein OmpA-like peptidoglycan-associated protein